MPVAPYQAFIQPVTSVDSTATADTLVFDQQTVISNTVKFNTLGDWTASIAPAATAGATQLLPAAQRSYFRIAVPSDGLSIYVGAGPITQANGALIGPGALLKVTGSTSPVWVVAAGAASTFFYQTG